MYTYDILNEDFDSKNNNLTKEQVDFFKDSKVRNTENNLYVCYHSSSSSNITTFNQPINWFSVDFDYSREFGNKTYECYLNCKRIFDCKDTNERVFDIIPIYPFYFSSEFNNILRRLGLTEEDGRRLIDEVCKEQFVSEDEKKRYMYKLDIHIVTRTKAFKDIVESKGYDSIKTIEDGNICYGVFDSYVNEIKSISNKRPTNSTNINS